MLQQLKSKLTEDAVPKTPKQRAMSESSDIDDGGSHEPVIESNVPHIQLHNEIAASKFSEGLTRQADASDSQTIPHRGGDLGMLRNVTSTTLAPNTAVATIGTLE